MANKEAAPAPAEGTEAPKKKKTLLIIIIAVVALLVVGGGAAVFLLTSKPAAEKQAKADAEEHAGEEGAEEEGAEEEEHPPVYEKLETFTVNLADGDTYLQLEVSLKLGKPEIQEKIKARMPEVRDGILRLLSGKTPEELADAEGKDKLAKEVRGVVNKVIGAKSGKSGVQSVLFTSFIIQ